MRKLVYFIVVCGIFCACNSNVRLHTRQLKWLDEQLESSPKMVLDSLQHIDADQLTVSQRAYYHLLSASATDKNLKNLANDSCLLVALGYFTDNKDVYNIARCQYYLGRYQHKHNNIKNAFELFKQAEQNAKESNKDVAHLLGLIYYQQGLILKQQYNYSEAAKIFDKSFDKFIESKDTISATYSLKYKGVLQINKKDFNQAHKTLIQSLNLINSTHNNSLKKTLAQNSVLFAISYYYLQNKEYDKSLNQINDCITFLSKNNINISSEYYFNIARIHYYKHQIDSAKLYCQKMIKIAKRQNNANNITNGYRTLSNILEKEGDYKKACSYRKYSEQLKDSLTNATYQNNILELEKKYNTSEAQKQLLQAKYDKYKSLALITLFVFIVFEAGYIANKYHKKLKTKYIHLSKIAKHHEWGFAVAKEFINENHVAYNELEKTLNREKALHNINTEFYNRFHEALMQQKANYLERLFYRLTTLDGNFANKFQSLFPEFNTDELLLASFIQHQWKLIDIASILHIDIEAARKRKKRLEQKISLKLGRDIDINDYLIHL